MPRTFTARYPGICPECMEEIEPGSEVTYNPRDQVVHEECNDGAAPARPKAEICPLCNLQKPCECASDVRQMVDHVVTPAASAARLAKHTASAAAPAYILPVNDTPNAAALTFFALPDARPEAPANPNDVALDFFATPASTSPAYVTLEDQADEKVKRDTYGRPLILQPDGSTKPYSRASSYGGQLDDKTNVEKWSKRQIVRGVAIALRGGRQPGFLDAVPERLFDPWEDQDSDKGDKRMLDSLAERAQDLAGSNLKSQLGTDIHYATELIDLGESLDFGLRDFEPKRREILKERADAYYKKIQEYRIKWDSVETFGVQDDLEVAGTWDRRGSVPWWPQHLQVIGDVKTSSTMDFAGITYAVQLATYAHMQAYDLETAVRTPHEDMNEKWALIVHVERFMGGAVELYPVNIDWGWRHAVLARQVIVARREGGRKGKDAVISKLDDREAQILSAASHDELNELRPEIMAMPKWLRQIAERRWEELS
jgi:hypothetical protein